MFPRSDKFCGCWADVGHSVNRLLGAEGNFCMCLMMVFNAAPPLGDLAESNSQVSLIGFDKQCACRTVILV